ncbi:CoA-transferase family III [Actinacidiphila alni]|uniref:CoA-transferase family III n=1 Tax=Actinacidiphila alni TaxID=380248 RepID=A0A1I2HTF7_9ACTN|nr:CoA transferase [Actinacidiphila alni]SFF32693.1 CoA-transferase family III [Actinacidiphila alni]
MFSGTGASDTGSSDADAAGTNASGIDASGLTGDLWAALGGAPSLLERVGYGTGGGLPAAVPVMALGRATTAVCALAAAELAAVRSGPPVSVRGLVPASVPAVRVTDGAVATAFTSERHLLIDGRPGATFAPLSRFWPTADGWIRTHANYPHHRARLLTALGLRDRDDTDALVAEVARRLAATPGEQSEQAVYAADGLAVAVRTASAWAAGEPGRAAAARPVVERRAVGTAPARSRALPPAALPAEGVRVLDLTRVIAGPVATRTLGLLGADVLRIDSPRLPELWDAQADTGFGKRSTALDLAVRADRAVFEELLGSADVVVTGYRPGALDRYGLSAEALLERRPGLIVAQLSAWGFDGPWAGRRGFDSLVQAATGIALLQADAEGRPGALPGQFLDHGTGYLIAAGVLRALTERLGPDGAGRLLRFALATTAARLLGLPADPVPAAERPDHSGRLAETDSPMGRLRYALPPIRYDGSPTTWSRPPSRPAADAPRWQP